MLHRSVKRRIIVNFSTIKEHRFFRPAVGALLTVICSLVLWATPLGDAWTNGSYDYLFRFGTYSVTNQVVVILMDNDAYAELGQSRGQPWDRALHTRLFNKLADDGCALVVPDIMFRKAGDAQIDQALASAMHRITNLVLAADQAESEHPGLASIRPLLPLDIFTNAARGHWGVGWLDPDLDNVVRRHWPFPSPGPYPSLPEQAAMLMGAPLGKVTSEKWIRYYDFNTTWTRLSYHFALEQNPGYFHGKIVFIGNKPATPFPDGEYDKKQVPQTRWTDVAVGGVEVQTAIFLNLMNGDWLRRLPWPGECLLLIFSGGAFGFGLSWFQSWLKFVLAPVAGLLVMVVGVSLSSYTNYWFPWLVVAGGQLPCALVWAVFYPKVRPLTTAVPATAASTSEGRKTIVLSFPEEESPDAPDFELFNPPVGKGAYGKVWVVKNAIGQWQALKAIYQSSFGENTRPFEAEFKGLQKYKPVSEKHPGLLRIELISKMRAEGYFYYVMELGDAQAPGWEKNPPSYKPKDLESLRKQAPGRRLPAAECLRIITVLADALDFLHRQGLIHRDIKPSNVIFVNGRPKLADIGLVADIRPPEHNNTLVGTPGYMPPMPERPGTVQADIYAMGMMLYVISSGQDPAFFPDISSTLMGRSGQGEFLRLDAIIIKACQPDTQQRYASTALMLKDLQDALKPV